MFMENEEAILQGNFTTGLLDKCKYEAQINDILKISISNVYQSTEVIEKELVGYEILKTLLNIGCNAILDKKGHYNQLIRQLLDLHEDAGSLSLYQEVLSLCKTVSVMTDGKSLQNFQKIKGFDIK